MTSLGPHPSDDPSTEAAEDVERGKPDPQASRSAALRLGVDPARSLVVEDAPAGVAAGLAARRPVVAVTTSHDRAEHASAHAVVPDPGHLEVAPSEDGRHLTASLTG